MLVIEFIGFQDRFMEFLEGLGMPDHHIPVNTFIFFEINPEF
jgi:hypothetical protein